MLVVPEYLEHSSTQGVLLTISGEDAVQSKGLGTCRHQ